jgi:hypothetical protein
MEGTCIGAPPPLPSPSICSSLPLHPFPLHAGEGECTCSFTVKWRDPFPRLPKAAADVVPAGMVQLGIEDLCFFGGWVGSGSLRCLS